MPILRKLGALSSLALRTVIGNQADGVLNFLGDKFSDRSQRINQALLIANERSWKAFEVTLAGSSWWDRCKAALSGGDEQAFRKQVQAFLEVVPVTELPCAGPEFRQVCLKELRAARQAKLLPGENPPTDELTAQAQAFARYTDPKSLLDAEWEAIMGMAGELHEAGYANLSRFIAIRPDQNQPLLVIAVRYFFRREVESDPKLSAGLTFQQLEGISEALDVGFRNLNDALAQHGQRLEQLLSDVQIIVTETRDDVRAMRGELNQLSQLIQGQTQPAQQPALATETHEDVQDVKAELQRQSQQIRDLYLAVLKALEQQRQQAAAPPTPSPAPPVATAPALVAPMSATLPPVEEQPASPETTDWQQVQQLVARCRALPKAQQNKLPGLFRAVNQLETVTTSSPTPGKPTLRRVQGAPVSNLFTAAPAQTRAAGATGETEPVTPAPKPNLPSESATTSSPSASSSKVKGVPLSSLFSRPAQPAQAAQPDAEKSSEVPQPPTTPDPATTQPPKPVRRPKLSPLFGGPAKKEPDEPKK